MPSRDWQRDIALDRERERKARTLLGLPADADAEQIRRAYRQASLAHHPDTNLGDAEALRRFALISSAYLFLTKGEADRMLDQFDAPPPPLTDGKYRMDNPWGYWCWWRENFFGA